MSIDRFVVLYAARDYPTHEMCTVGTVIVEGENREGAILDFETGKVSFAQRLMKYEIPAFYFLTIDEFKSISDDYPRRINTVDELRDFVEKFNPEMTMEVVNR
jgi:hypothetical protein